MVEHLIDAAANQKDELSNVALEQLHKVTGQPFSGPAISPLAIRQQYQQWWDQHKKTFVYDRDRVLQE